MSGRVAGTLGIAGVGVFALSVVALHFLDPDPSVVDEPISMYSLGDRGWLSQVGTIAMGVGLIGVAVGLRSTLGPGRRVAVPWLLLVAAGVGFVISGVFIPDPTGTTETTISGALHDLGGYVSMLSVLVSVWMLRGVFARDALYESFAGTQLLFAVLVTALMVALLALGEGRLGLTQRVFVAAVVVWLLVLAFRIRRTETPAVASAG